MQQQPFIVADKYARINILLNNQTENYTTVVKGGRVLWESFMQLDDSDWLQEDIKNK